MCPYFGAFVRCVLHNSKIMHVLCGFRKEVLGDQNETIVDGH